jgi:hypothetical protein
MEKIDTSQVTPFQELPLDLKKKLIKEFSTYVYHQLKFRHYVMFFSFWALAYQTRNLVSTYLEFQTVVKVEISKPFTIEVPGTSICTDRYHMVLKSKLAKRYPEINERISQLNDTTDKDAIMNIYREYKQKAYENSTLDQWFSLVVDPEMLIKCKLILLPKYHVNRSLPYPDCYDYSKPYYHMPYGAGLCWSFFTQINPIDYIPSKDRLDWYRVDIPEEGKIASFTVNFEIFDDIVYDEMPFSQDNEENKPELYVTTHNPKSLPSSISLDRAVVRRGTNFDVYFSQTNAKLLRWPFRTDCIWYEEEGFWAKYKSSDQCIDDCLSRKAAAECGCIFNQSRGGRMTKWAKPDSDYPFCKEYNLKDDEKYPEEHLKPRKCANLDIYEVQKTECTIQGICNQNCYEEYYKYEVKEVFFDEEDDGNNRSQEYNEFRSGLPLFPKSRPNESWATVNIIRKDIADVSYEHTAEMIFVEFVCYFGGLLGLWLGVSILDMYHQCLIWWDEVPIEYAKWLERQRTSTNVEKFSAKNSHISIVSAACNDDDYNTAIRNIYNTKY